MPCQECQDRRKGEYDENGTVEIRIGPGCSVNRSVRLGTLRRCACRCPRGLQGGGGVNNTASPRSLLLAASVRPLAAIRCVMPVTISTAARDRASGTTELGACDLGRRSVARLCTPTC